MTYSKRLNLKIRRAIRLLSKHPLLGIQTEVKNIRVLVVGDYAIFYQVAEETISVVTIWDCRQTPENSAIPKQCVLAATKNKGKLL